VGSVKILSGLQEKHLENTSVSNTQEISSLTMAGTQRIVPLLKEDGGLLRCLNENE